MFREPWRTRLLLASLAGNLFAVGLVAAFFAFAPPRRPPGPEAAVERMARDLAGPDAERFRAAMQHAWPQQERARRAMDEARMEMARSIGQTPYDADAVRQAMLRWQSAWLEWSNQFGAGMLAAVSGLSPDGRARLAEAGQRHRPR